jgi:hypothetical protein
LSYNIDITSSSYDPHEINITTGDMVVWTNRDSVTQSILSDSSSELDSGDLGVDESYSYTFNTSGVYTYHSAANSSVNGTINVVPLSMKVCSQDSDCVEEQCCHATSCVNSNYAPECNEDCDNNCSGPMDCGAGACICSQGRCVTEILSGENGFSDGSDGNESSDIGEPGDNGD